MPFKDKEKKKEYDQMYYQMNKEKLYERTKLRRKNNPQARKISDKKYRETHREQKRIYDTKYRRENRHVAREWERNRRKTDPLFKLRTNLRKNIGRSLKREGFKKICKTMTILGTDYKTFKEYLEGLWEPWMSWDNYGLYKKDTFNYGWDIDHIIPTCTAKTKEELYKLNHYTNLKPLCSKVNRDIKKNKV